MAKQNNRSYWIIWGILTIMMAAYLTYGLLEKASATQPMMAAARTMLLPGQTSHAHHQIELACESCHTEAFGGEALIQNACMDCHQEELELADDSHPASKFDDPSNVDRLEKLDAQKCITCHQEHRPDITHEMGVTLPTDFCAHCHSGEDQMPPDHEGLPYDGCAAAGCHNFHDNRALYEDYLVKHGNAPWLLEEKQLPIRGFAEAVLEMMNYPIDQYPLTPLTAAQHDAPVNMSVDPKVHADWLASSHAQNGVNCSACHTQQIEGRAKPQWVEKPDYTGCQSCHAKEIKGFLAGKHGSPMAQGLAPMTPAKARLPMKKEAHDTALTCVTCHDAHAPDTRKAAVDSCMSCHNDTHTMAYKESPHFTLWQKEIAGEAPTGSGVSCASCHMPRIDMETEDGSRIVVQHNQNDTLRPNEKMIRPVCMSCHGLSFSIDAMADEALINNNFNGKPSKHVESIDMAMKKEAEAQKRRALIPEPEEVEDEEEVYEEDFDEYN